MRVWFSFSPSSVWAGAPGAGPSNCSSVRHASVGVWFPRDECGLTTARQGIAQQSPERVVVVVAPEREFAPSGIDAVQHVLVQHLIAQAAVERLDEGVLLRLARIDVVPFGIAVVRPFQDSAAGELRRGVTDNAGALSIDPNESIQFPRHPSL